MRTRRDETARPPRRTRAVDALLMFVFPRLGASRWFARASNHVTRGGSCAPRARRRDEGWRRRTTGLDDALESHRRCSSRRRDARNELPGCCLRRTSSTGILPLEEPSAMGSDSCPSGCGVAPGGLRPCVSLRCVPARVCSCKLPDDDEQRRRAGARATLGTWNEIQTRRVLFLVQTTKDAAPAGARDDAEKLET